MQDKLLTTKEAAPLLGVSEAFLERDRWAGAKVPFVRIGSRAVRYRISDIESYIESRVQQSVIGRDNQ
jgi:predicted DNA-binding transcriptional regulator AlpA